MAKPPSQKCTLVYPKHHFKPEELLTFIEMDGFSADWIELGLDADDLLALQVAIMSGPSRPPVIPGTGGLRKIRFAPKAWNVGKSGGVRICYVYFAAWGVVLLVIAYPKSEKDTLTAEEKRDIRQLIARQHAEFSSRNFR